MVFMLAKSLRLELENNGDLISTIAKMAFLLSELPTNAEQTVI
jgi:hypothetical protein